MVVYDKDMTSTILSTTRTGTTTRNSVALTAFALIAVVSLVTRSVATVMTQAEAANAISESRNKGQQGEIASDGKRNGGGSDGGGGGCATCG